MMDIKNFIDTYGELLDTDQNEFFEKAEYALELEDYSTLVDMIRNSQIELKPEIIFDGYKEYKLFYSNTSINYFLFNNFKKKLNDFKDLNSKLVKDNEHLFRREDIFIEKVSNKYKNIGNAYLYVNSADKNHRINHNLQINFEDEDGDEILIILNYYLSNLEEIFKIIKIIPNYGIGWNPVELDEVINNFIEATKECLGVQ